MTISTGINYRLRAGSPMPTEGGTDFIIHSFMALRSTSEMDSCATDLPASNEFMGQGGVLVSASYTKLPLSGGAVFKGKKSDNGAYVEEDNY